MPKAGFGFHSLKYIDEQNKYLTRTPEISYFKTIYKRHSPFSIESIRETIDGTVAAGNTLKATISRVGDLVNKCWIEIDPTNAVANNSATDPLDAAQWTANTDYKVGDVVYTTSGVANTSLT